jgi:uncharacterized membrane protein
MKIRTIPADAVVVLLDAMNAAIEAMSRVHGDEVIAAGIPQATGQLRAVRNYLQEKTAADVDIEIVP